VPNLGTIITGGTSGAYGELMNCSASISTTPTAAGAAMPSTGILKLKNVVGVFQDNENLNIPGPITLALANGIGQRGWIEVVMDDAAGWTIGRAQKLQITGDWYVHQTATSGSAHQQLQFPNYGAGTNFYLAGCWIQQPDKSGTYVLTSNVVTVTYTAHGYFIGQTVWLDFTSGSGVDGFYVIIATPTANTFTVALTGSDTSGNVTASVMEFYPAVLSGTGSPWATTMTTDERCKFVECLAGGIIRIGGNGTSTIGHLPASGRKVAIPNVLLKSAATASRANDSVPNATNTTRPDVTTTNAGQIDISGAIGHWYLIPGQAYSVKLHRIALFDQYQITECATPIDLNDGGNGGYTITSDTPALVLTSNYATGGKVYNWKNGRSGTIGSSDYGLNASYCNGITFLNCTLANRLIRTNASGYPAYFIYCNDLTFTGCKVVGGALYINTCNRININNHQWSDNFSAASSTTTPQAAIAALYSNDVKIDGFAWFEAVTGLNPTGPLFTGSFVTNYTIRNIGTRASPLDVGAGANDTTFIYTESGNCSNVRLQRIYCSNVATRFISSANNANGIIVENCAGDYGDTHAGLALNQILKNVACASVPSSGASVYGSIFYHIFTSTSAGRLGLIFNETTATYSPYITTNFTTSATGTSGYNSNGGLALINSGDYVLFEFPYLIKGIDSFPNSAPTVTTASNMTIEYQINTGSGWSALKTFNGSNLNGESISATTGFYFRIKCSCSSTNAANILTVVYCLTSSDTTAQEVTYALDLYTLSLTGVQAGSDVIFYAAGTTTVRETDDAISGTDATYVYETIENIDIGVFKSGYIPYFVRNYTLTTANATLPVAQVIDRAYLL
jgi:hypothetical protein